MLMRKRSSMTVSSRMNTNLPSSYSGTSRLLLDFYAKPFSDPDLTASPTSILETRIFSPTFNPFFTQTKPRPTWHCAEPRAVGLSILNSLHNEKPDIHRKSGIPDCPMVLFGSQLKIQIPTLYTTSVSAAAWAETPGSPIEFGVKNKSSQLVMLSPSRRPPMAYSGDTRSPPTEMQLSEDYTCEIAHGPNPKTTHIFDNCIVESCCTDHGYVRLQRENGSLADHSFDFLAYCHACNNSLGPGKDIFMYSEKAFCSNECRHNEMMFDEGMENASSGFSMVVWSKSLPVSFITDVSSFQRGIYFFIERSCQSIGGWD